MTYDPLVLRQELKRDEGVRLKPYVDTVGKTTIGCGRNLTDVGISATEADMLLASDIRRSEADLDRHLRWWREEPDARQRALLNLVFNMGWGDGQHGLSTFVNTLKLFEAGNYEGAANGFLNSKWAKQVGPGRAKRVTDLIRSG